MHYEKSCLLESHYLTTKVPKQLIHKYITIKAWKYEQLINKMSHHKINKLYYSCNVVVNGHLYNAMYRSYMWMYSIVFDFLVNYTLVASDNYITINVNATPNQPLIYNFDTNDHGTCTHFHCH
jgi:hypothetical protein